MSAPAIEIAAEAPIQDAFTSMRAHHVQHLCVVRRGELVGIVSEQDLHRAMPSALSSTQAQYEHTLDAVRVERIMSPHVLSITPDSTLSGAMTLLTSTQIHALPVLERGHLVGILTGTDCLRALNPVG